MRLFLAACAVCLSLPAVALKEPPASPLDKPIKIFDGPGVPIADLLFTSAADDEVPSPQDIQETPRVELMSENRFPIRSEKWSIGPIGDDEGRDIPSYLLTMPFFIVGYDRVSVNWMQQNLDILVENRAIGYVINVESVAQMDELMRLTNNQLILAAVPGDSMADTLNLRHYPAYVDQQGLVR